MGAKVKMKYLRTWAKKIKFTGSLNKIQYSAEQLMSRLRRSHKSYEMAKKQAWECRRTFLAELEEKVDDKDKARIRDIRKREDTKHHWSIWKILSATTQGAAVLAVEIQQDGQAVRITERRELERAIMQCLSKWFSLTYQNPSMNSLFT